MRGRVLNGLAGLFLGIKGANSILLHDNSGLYIVHMANAYIQVIDISIMESPARSPRQNSDLNPIEHT